MKGKTAFITGSSRGIGCAIAKRLASEGANVIITGKTVEPHPKLQGTIHSVAEEIVAQGGSAIATPLDVTDEKSVIAALKVAHEHFGSIDMLVNNASAIALRDTKKLSMKRFDLLMSVNVRGTYMCCKHALQYLEKSTNPHILNIAPPLNMKAKWFSGHVAYTYSKYGMSICTLGMAEEFKAQGIAVNSLWPKTTIATAAVEFNFPPEIYQASRKPSIMADAAFYILSQSSREISGHFFIDEDVLRETGVIDFSDYAVNPNVPLCPDFYLD